MKTPYLIALAMVIIITLWMASGLLRSPEQSANTAILAEADQRLLVQTAVQTAQSVQLSLTVQGHVEANRQVNLRSDITGRISEILVAEGEKVELGAVLMRIDEEDRAIKLNREKALLQSKQKAYARAQTLLSENFQSKSALEDAYAALKAAEASVAQMEFEIKKLNITAPFPGVVNKRMVEQGSYVSVNSEIAQFVDNSILVVVAPVAQQNIQQLTLGAQAQVRFATGNEAIGKLRFISQVAEEGTRTFRVEIEVNNANRIIPAGISAEVKIPVGEVTGHFISPALLGLNSEGQVGVKVVDETSTVVFYPITIIQANADGLWVRGLPTTVQVITVGQGFVEAGIKVNVKQDKAA